MPFTYADTSHTRKHGPEGYDNYKTYKDWLRDEFTFRCVYCLERERWYPNGQAGFGVDHVKPKSRAEYEHLINYYKNLVYACNRCNSAKKERILIDPCAVPFAVHLQVDYDGEIIGLTDEGRRLINILGLDCRLPTEERKEKIQILKLFKRYPNDEEVRGIYFNAFGFPEDLPDLTRHSRTLNSNPDAVRESYYSQREAGILPETYGL
jgi:HNH endonuclease